MSKIKITADIIKSIIVGVLQNKDDGMTDSNKMELLSKCGLDHKNAFYTRKHRLVPAKDYIQSLNDSIHKGYCLVDLSENARVFNANLDFTAVAATLTFWVQTTALPFLDELIDNANLEVIGERYKIPNVVDDEGSTISRSATVSLTPVIVDEITTASEIGESAICRVSVAMNLTEDLAIANDVILDLTLKKADTDSTPTTFYNVPVIKIDAACTASTRPLTQANLGKLGLSETAKMFALSFSCYCPISNLGKALERLVAAYGSEQNKILNEVIAVKLKFPNGARLVQDMICTDAKFTGDLTNPCMMSFVLNPIAKNIRGEAVQ